MKKPVFVWMLMMVVSVFAAGCVYISFQQTARGGAYALAIMAAKQTALQLPHVKSPLEALPAATFMDAAYPPFVVIFDNHRRFVASSAGNYGLKSNFYSDYFDKINRTGEYRAIWETVTHDRFAIVGIKNENGYVIGAYSLSEADRDTADFAALLLKVCVFMLSYARRPYRFTSG